MFSWCCFPSGSGFPIHGNYVFIFVAKLRFSEQNGMAHGPMLVGVGSIRVHLESPIVDDVAFWRAQLG